MSASEPPATTRATPANSHKRRRAPPDAAADQSGVTADGPSLASRPRRSLPDPSELRVVFLCVIIWLISAIRLIRVMGGWLRAALLAQSYERVVNAAAAFDALKRRVDNDFLLGGAVAVGADLLTITVEGHESAFQALIYLGGPNDSNARAAATSILLLCGASERGLAWVRDRIPATPASFTASPYAFLASELDAYARHAADSAPSASETAECSIASMPGGESTSGSEDDGEADLGLTVVMVNALCNLLTPLGSQGLLRVFARHGGRMDSVALLSAWLECGGELRTCDEWKSFPTWAAALPVSEASVVSKGGVPTLVYLLPSKDFVHGGLHAAAAALVAKAAHARRRPGASVLFHGTDWGSIESLVGGVDVRIPASERNYLGHDFGTGFYMSREIETAAFFSTVSTPLIAVFLDARDDIAPTKYCELVDPMEWAAVIGERYIRRRLHRILAGKHVVEGAVCNNATRVRVGRDAVPLRTLEARNASQVAAVDQAAADAYHAGLVGFIVVERDPGRGRAHAAIAL